MQSVRHALVQLAVESAGTGVAARLAKLLGDLAIGVQQLLVAAGRSALHRQGSQTFENAPFTSTRVA